MHLNSKDTVPNVDRIFKHLTYYKIDKIFFTGNDMYKRFKTTWTSNV